jgi:hypothetical protein
MDGMPTMLSNGVAIQGTDVVEHLGKELAHADQGVR